MEVTRLWRYPVKSMTGTAETSLELDPWGAVGDRRWAVVETDGTPVTGRTVRDMLTLRPRVTAEGVRLEVDGRSLDVSTPTGGGRHPVGFSRLESAADAGDEAAAFLSDVLAMTVRLVWQPDPAERTTSSSNGGLPGETLSLADAGPLLMTSQDSLARLQEWVGDAPYLDMRRFRPNVVVAGAEPFAEEGWREVRIGEAELRVQGVCDRCVFTTIDPVTREKGHEPIRTLARHHSWDGKTWFGVWLVPRSRGEIAVGDAVSFDESVSGHV
jgi:uncharacterized protein